MEEQERSGERVFSTAIKTAGFNPQLQLMIPADTDPGGSADGSSDWVLVNHKKITAQL